MMKVDVVVMKTMVLILIGTLTSNGAIKTAHQMILVIVITMDHSQKVNRKQRQFHNMREICSQRDREEVILSIKRPVRTSLVCTWTFMLQEDISISHGVMKTRDLPTTTLYKH